MPIRLHRWILEIIGFALLAYAFISDGFPGSADAMNHFLISKRAFSQPELFLDQWNKPLFTLISAPFAQFGFIGMRVMNVLIGYATAIVLYRTAKLDNARMSIVMPFILLGMPIYTWILPSAMTEPLFGLLIASIILALRKDRLWLAMLLVGFTPFARQEGFVLIPFALIYLIASRNLKHVPLLTVGSLLVGIAGMVILGDPKYLVNSFPYGSAAADIYGHGSWDHFITEYEMLFGIPNTLLILVGVTAAIIGAISLPIKLQLNEPGRLALYFSLLVSVTFFGGHSYLWAKGAGGSVGLLRVIAAASPAFAYLAYRGVMFIFEFKPLRSAAFHAIGTGLIAVFLIHHLVQVIEIPFAQTPTEATIQKMTDWGSEYDFGTGEIYYADPSIYFFAEDRFPLKHPEEKPMINGSTASRDLKPGDHVIWDAHFGPNEGRLPYDSLRLNPFMKIVNRFTPKKSFNVLGGLPYQLVVFKMTDTRIVRSKLKRVRIVETFEDFNQESGRIVEDPLESDLCMTSDTTQKFTTIRDTLTHRDAKNIVQLNIKAKVFWSIDDEKPEFSLVASIGDKVNTLLYSGYRSDKMDISPGVWNEIQHEVTLPPGLPDSAELVVYVWFVNGSKILVDDLVIEEEVVEEVPVN